MDAIINYIYDLTKCITVSRRCPVCNHMYIDHGEGSTTCSTNVLIDPFQEPYTKICRCRYYWDCISEEF